MVPLSLPPRVVVQKYGGSSLANPERIGKVADRIVAQIARGERPVIVASAMGDTTDDLLAAMQQLCREPDPRELDQLLATGEIASCALLCGALRARGVAARSFHAASLEIRTGDDFGAATIVGIARGDRLRTALAAGEVPVIAGFQGMTASGDFTTLGRGGSDITAVAVAQELGLRLCAKFTDEDGVYSTDPRLVPAAHRLETLDYDEMEALARFGAGILHPRAIEYARRAGIAIEVRSSFTWGGGTRIFATREPPSRPVSGLAADRRYALAEIRGLGAGPEALPALLAEPAFRLQAWRPAGDGSRSLVLAFPRSESFAALTAVWQAAAELEASDVMVTGRAMVVTLVGRSLAAGPTLAAEVTALLTAAGRPPLAVQAVGLRLSLAVPESEGEAAVLALHRRFCETPGETRP